jgi:hypothetical protein
LAEQRKSWELKTGGDSDSTDRPPIPGAYRCAPDPIEKKKKKENVTERFPSFPSLSLWEEMWVELVEAIRFRRQRLAREAIMAAKEISVKKYVVRLSNEERERLETLTGAVPT